MKTAEEWFAEMFTRPLKHGGYLATIREIQADAIRGAVSAIRYGDGYVGNLNMLNPALRLANSIRRKSKHATSTKD